VAERLFASVFFGRAPRSAAPRSAYFETSLNLLGARCRARGSQLTRFGRGSSWVPLGVLAAGATRLG